LHGGSAGRRLLDGQGWTGDRRDRQESREPDRQPASQPLVSMRQRSRRHVSPLPHGDPDTGGRKMSRATSGVKWLLPGEASSRRPEIPPAPMPARVSRGAGRARASPRSGASRPASAGPASDARGPARAGDRRASSPGGRRDRRASAPWAAARPARRACGAARACAKPWASDARLAGVGRERTGDAAARSPPLEPGRNALGAHRGRRPRRQWARGRAQREQRRAASS